MTRASTSVLSSTSPKTSASRRSTAWAAPTSWPLCAAARIASVRPSPRESVRLRDLTLVMWKDEVGAAGVNIERRPQIARAHDGALDVPARAPGSPRARPRGLSRRLRLPEHEVERIALARVVGMIAARGGHRQQLPARKVAEAAEGRPRPPGR